MCTQSWLSGMPGPLPGPSLHTNPGLQGPCPFPTITSHPFHCPQHPVEKACVTFSPLPGKALSSVCADVTPGPAPWCLG